MAKRAMRRAVAAAAGAGLLCASGIAVAPASSAAPSVSVSSTTTAPPTTKPAAPSVADLTSQLDAKLADWQRRYGAAGVAASVDIPGVVHWTSAAGTTDGRTAYTPQTQSRVGSATKTFTSVIVLQLVQEGKLSLDDPLAKWQPTFPGAYSIKVRNLLNHTSGIPELQLDDLFFIITSLFNPYKHWTTDELVTFAKSPLPIWSLRKGTFIQRGLLYGAGEGWTYSQTNFVLLGDIIEKVTGKSYGQNVRDRIVNPLGLSHTVFADSSYAPFIVGNTNLLGLLPLPIPTTSLGSYEAATSSAFSAGAMVSTPDDQVKFIQAVHDGRLLSPASLALMHTTVPLQVPGGTADPNSQYGFGIFRDAYAGHVTWGHGGAIPGFVSSMAYEPATNVTVSVESNSDNERPAKDSTASVRQIALIDWDLRLTADAWVAARAAAGTPTPS